MRNLITVTAIMMLLFLQTGTGQDARRDKATFAEPKNEFLDEIRKDAETFKKKEKEPGKEFRLDFSTIAAPTSLNEFKKAWHTKPVTQGISGMCWCFSATSYFESEIYRLTKREVKLSELYTVYWEYVEKARRYVQERGNSTFGEGSEANAVPRMWKLYGVMPADAYTGMKPGQKVHDHSSLFQEMHTYLASLKTSAAWNEEEAVQTIKSILNHWLGEPPTKVTVGEKSMTPKEYLAQVLRLNLDDYVEVMSAMDKPYYERVELEVQDNWWHSKDYLNVPLDEFMALVKRAVRSGQTLGLGGDTSEPGYEGHAGIGVVPTFDIPSAYIDESARQFRVSNGTTGDDHGIHLIGFTEKDGKDWYLIKDSGSGSRNNSHPGYYFYHEDFVKLKMLSLTVHKDLVSEILKRVSH
jgi:bleomycin hydrolase